MLPFQHSGGFGGALSFTKAVYDCLFKHKTDETVVYGLYDSNRGLAQQYNLFEYANSHDIELFDVSKKPLREFYPKNLLIVSILPLVNSTRVLTLLASRRKLSCSYTIFSI